MSKLGALIRAVGPVSAANILMRRKLGLASAIAVQTRAHKINIWLRPCDSDLYVASQIFTESGYDFGSKITSGLNRVAKAWLAEGIQPVIIDAGANVGYSSLFFSAQYPDAKVIALEIEPQTFAMLRKNVAGCPRIKPSLAALWSHDDGVDFHSGAHQSWSNFVSDKQATDVGGRTPSVRLDQLLLANERALVIKLDIEGAEREACSVKPEVLRTCPVIVVEPHDFMFPGKSCLSSLLSALAHQDRDVLISGENLIFLDGAIAT